jgi:septin family protein
MNLKFRKNNDMPLKILFFGEDGTGKSTAAESYAKKHKLNAVAIDVDNTNFTEIPILELDLTSDIKSYNNVKDAINQVATSDFDTIIIDGVSSLLEMLTPDKQGMIAYKQRADRFSSILNTLNKSGLNVIFIGQIDMEIIISPDYVSPKPIIKINSIVNQKYRCVKDGEKFKVVTEKFRGGGKSPSKPKSKKNNLEFVNELIPDKEPVVKENRTTENVKEKEEKPNKDELNVEEKYDQVISDLQTTPESEVTLEAFKIELRQLQDEGDITSKEKQRLLYYAKKMGVLV